MIEPRYMTLTEAQAIECNRCGDCCDSRRVGFTRTGEPAWSWGKATGGEEGLIIPLRVMVPFGMEDALPRSPIQNGDRIEAFHCSAFVPTGDGVTSWGGDCSLHNAVPDERPHVCNDFPVRGPYAEDIKLKVMADGEYPLPFTNTLTRCAWAGVVIVAEDRLG